MLCPCVFCEQLKKKSVELARACQKHYQLEQELAFYKLDSKFDALGQLPAMLADARTDGRPMPDASSVLTPGSSQQQHHEATYVGRGRYEPGSLPPRPALADSSTQAAAAVSRRAGTMTDAPLARTVKLDTSSLETGFTASLQLL